MFNSNPNQRVVTIHRNNPEKGGKQFLAIYTEVLAAASRNISGEVAFKLFLYLCANKDGYESYYSPQNFANIYGVSAESGRRAFLQLEEKGYLVNKGNNSYEFYELPQVEEELVIEEERRNVKVKSNGVIEVRQYTFTEFCNSPALKNRAAEEIKALWDKLEVAQ